MTMRLVYDDLAPKEQLVTLRRLRLAPAAALSAQSSLVAPRHDPPSAANLRQPQRVAAEGRALNGAHLW